MEKKPIRRSAPEEQLPGQVRLRARARFFHIVTSGAQGAE
jgi:hypothetical protein